MKLLINAMILSDKNTGLGVYTYSYINYVCPILEKENIEFDILVRDKKFLPADYQKNAIEVYASNYFARNFKTKKYYTKDYDMVISTTQHGNLKCKSKQFITIHDLTPLLYPKGRLHQYAYYKFYLPLLVKKCDGIITVSQNTKNDIIKYLKVDESKVKVIYCALPNCETVSTNESNLLSKWNLYANSYYCITGIHYPYKNIHSVVEAYKKNENLHNRKVVIIGNDDCKYGAYLKELIKKYNLDDLFIFTGFVSDEEKNQLISNCLACIYPSLYEGFGLPLLESMRYKKLILSSNSSCLPEIGKNGAIYFDGNNVDDLIKKLLFINDDKNSQFLSDVINCSQDVLNGYTWEKTASEIVDYIQQNWRE